MFNFKTFVNGAGLFSFVLVFSVLISFIVRRVYSVWSSVLNFTGRNELVFLNILHNDAIVISSLFFLLYFSFFNTFFKSIKWFVYLLKTVFFLISLFYAADVLMLVNFYKRLHYSDILKYGQEINVALSFLIPLKKYFFSLLSVEAIGITIVCVILTVLAFFLVFEPTKRHKKLQGNLLLIFGSCFLFLSFVPIKRVFVHGWAYRNMFANNMPKGLEQSYSINYIDMLKKKSRKKMTTYKGSNQRPDVILLIVESLSSCHSKYFSNINDYTPRLDEIAEKNLSFTNFFANGFTTNHGLIALFLGEPPLPMTGTRRHKSFDGFNQKKSLPFFLKSSGYTNFFLTTGDLGFTNKGEWLTQIGFDDVEGAEIPFYKEWPHFAFNAAPDKALYDHALKKIAGLKEEQHPYFMVLETVSSHLPFLDPMGRSNTEKAVFRYVDQQLGFFYHQLVDRGFFKNGILIITGDHRIIAPLSKAELDLFGNSAFFRIPLVVVTSNGKMGKIDAPFQQADLYSSLKWLVSDKHVRDSWDGNFLQPEPAPPFCILQPMPNDYDLVCVRCGLTESLIKLQGDDTYLFWGQIDPEVVRLVIERINRKRILRDQRYKSLRYARKPSTEKLRSQKTSKPHIIRGVSVIPKKFLDFCYRVQTNEILLHRSTAGTGNTMIRAVASSQRPDIKANGSDDPIVISQGEAVRITISLIAGEKAGQTADWWVAVNTPFAPPVDWYSLVYPELNWIPGAKMCTKTTLFDLATYEVLNMALPVGTYTFYFALDDPDGAATGPWWGMDSVQVQVR